MRRFVSLVLMCLVPITAVADSVAGETADASAHWWLVWVTIALVCITGALAFYTARLYGATVQVGRDARESSIDQGNKMMLSVKALESITTATRDNAQLMQGVLHKQMRAYVVVDIGAAVYQDTKLKFAAHPIIHNTGFTPARNVSYKVTSAVLNAILPEDIKFAEPQQGRKNDATMAPRQTFNIGAAVENRFEEKDVEEIMLGDTRRLYVWGTVTYDDIFGGSWETKFCHNYLFFKTEEGIRHTGYYFPRHNAAT